MEPKDDILLLGLGTGGTQAAHFIFQRETIEHLRIMGADTEKDFQEHQYSMNCIELLPPPFDKDGELARKSAALMEQRLTEQLRGIKMLCVLTCIGGRFSAFYSAIAIKIAEKNNLPATVIAILPHSSDNAEIKAIAQAGLNDISKTGCRVIPLDCEHFDMLFPNQAPEAVNQQTLIWASSTTLGFLKLLLQPPVETSNPDGVTPLTPAEMAEISAGLFANIKATYFNAQNLDIPTYKRKRINLQ